MEQMEHRITVTLSELGRGEASETNMERLLEGFQSVHPEVGAVVGGNSKRGTIDVTFALDAQDWQDAAAKGQPILVKGFEASGLPAEATEVVEVDIVLVPAEELEGDRELQLA